MTESWENLLTRHHQRLRREYSFGRYVRFRVRRWLATRLLLVRVGYQRVAGWLVRLLQDTCRHDINQITRLSFPNGDDRGEYLRICHFCYRIEVIPDDSEGG